MRGTSAARAEFVPLLNKAGGAGFQVTAYTQTWSDVEARIGSRAKAGQVAGNFNTMIMLRVKELATAELITLPKGQSFALLEGGQLWKIRMPLPATDSDMPETLTEITNEMERTYITNDHWYRVQEP